MPTFITDRASMLWDATAVPNAFFCEYMPTAPDGYVKVYLYTLMCAHAGAMDDETMLDDVAKALHMDKTEVEQALRYWERCRLIDRTKNDPPAYRFHSAQQMLMSKRQIPQDDAYESFAQALYSAFGDRRKLHGGETVLAYEWVEQLKLPPEVVMMLIQHMIATRGVQFSFKEAQKLATELSEQNIATLDQAEALFSRSESAWKGARKVLARMGKRRNPSMDELDLYVKWVTEWGYAAKAIENACAETTKGEPNFAYLDKILEGIRSRSGAKKLKASDVTAQLQAEKEESEHVRQMLYALGIVAPIVDQVNRLIYRQMRTLADHDVVVRAASEVGKRRGYHSLDDVQALLSAWQKKGLQDADAVGEYLTEIGALNNRLKALQEIVGTDCALSQGNRTLLTRWQQTYHMGENLQNLAGEYAKHTDKPMLYMERLLSNWHQMGITTVDGAKAEHDRFVEEAKKPKAFASNDGKKQVIEQQYTQRTYDPAEYDGLTAEMIEEALKIDT